MFSQESNAITISGATTTEIKIVQEPVDAEVEKVDN